MGSTDSSDFGDGGHVGSFDWTTTSPSTAVVETVAAVAGRPILELDPLYDVIDPDALDVLVAGGEDPTAPGPSVSFTYAGHEVTVENVGTVRVRPAA